MTKVIVSYASIRRQDMILPVANSTCRIGGAGRKGPTPLDYE